MLILGLILILLSPLWAYAAVKLPDPVMPNRSYLTLFGLALLGAWTAERQPVPVALLVVLYAAATVKRNRYWRNGLVFWQQASLEAPRKLRTHVNYAAELSRAGMLDESIYKYETILGFAILSNQAGTAAANLSQLYIQQFRRTNEPVWIDRAAHLLHEAALKWPEHALIRYARGCMFADFSRPAEAIEEFTAALEFRPKYPEALRHRAAMYGRLGDAENCRKDIEAADAMDGNRTELVEVKP